MEGSSSMMRRRAVAVRVGGARVAVADIIGWYLLPWLKGSGGRGEASAVGILRLRSS